MKALLAILNLRPVRIVLYVLLTGLLAALLTATIFWTQFDAMWIAFLGGVLFAAVGAMATQASKAHWLAMRRSMQLDRIRAQLSQETARSRNATEAMRIVEARMRLLGNAVPTLILYVDREQRCRYHNLAVEQKTGRTAGQIAGLPLREVIGNAYSFVEPRIADTLAGKTVDYEFAWTGTALPESYVARHVPYPPEESPARGFYLLLTSAEGRPETGPPARPQLAEPAPDTGIDRLAISSEGGSTIYLRSITDELMGWDDPHEKLEYALKENQFLLFAQKILPLKTSLPAPLCFEILLRLREEEDNLLPPGGFIPIAERYGMMENLDRWVVRHLVSWCCSQQRGDARWRVPLYCVNISEAALCNPEFTRFVHSELQSPGVPENMLCFEIGEPEVINHHAHAQRFINALKPAGCRFTLDAFGGAKVSFSYLRGLAIDFIKIDGVIIQNILRDPTELARARAINTVCQKTGMHSIAEFVETREVLDKLREIGVDYVQGFGIARPEPLAKPA
jgi:EAL domain-containing protein (putative c-di-GMP-specific phosphodiesterase class I)/PAS domain-containing protein